MPIKYNNNTVSTLKYNGNEVRELQQNGVTRWCHPYTMSVILGTGYENLTDFNVAVTNRHEPSVPAQSSVSTGDTIYYNDTLTATATARDSYVDEVTPIVLDAPVISGTTDNSVIVRNPNTNACTLNYSPTLLITPTPVTVSMSGGGETTITGLSAGTTYSFWFEDSMLVYVYRHDFTPTKTWDTTTVTENTSITFGCRETTTIDHRETVTVSSSKVNVTTTAAAALLAPICVTQTTGSVPTISVRNTNLQSLRLYYSTSSTALIGTDWGSIPGGMSVVVTLPATAFGATYYFWFKNGTTIMADASSKTTVYTGIKLVEPVCDYDDDDYPDIKVTNNNNIKVKAYYLTSPGTTGGTYLGDIEANSSRWLGDGVFEFDEIYYIYLQAYTQPSTGQKYVNSESTWATPGQAPSTRLSAPVKVTNRMSYDEVEIEFRNNNSVPVTAHISGWIDSSQGESTQVNLLDTMQAGATTDHYFYTDDGYYASAYRIEVYFTASGWDTSEVTVFSSY